jgi:hypothetical protein
MFKNCSCILWAYAVMSNHSHVVVCVDRAEAQSWSVEEVLQRYHTLHKGTLLSHQYLKDETLACYRHRLYDISWFMRNLNEYIARAANKEDGCTGRCFSPPSLALTLRAS